MSEDLMSDEVTPAGRAFERSAALTWNGALVKPLSGRRLIAAQSCGLKLFKAAAAEGAGLGMYDGIFWDAVLVVFLCVSDNSVSLKAVRLPEQVCEAALSWQEDQKLSPGTPKFLELVSLFNEIMADVMASMTEPVNKDGSAVDSGAQKKMEGESTGSLNSPSKSDTSQEGTHPTS